MRCIEKVHGSGLRCLERWLRFSHDLKRLTSALPKPFYGFRAAAFRTGSYAPSPKLFIFKILMEV